MSLEQVRRAVGVTAAADGTAIGVTDLGGVARGGLFGGQVVAQALSAAGLHVPDGSVPVSIHAHLVGASRVGPPVEYRVERVRDGRGLQHRVVRGEQGGKLIVHATVVSGVLTDGPDWQRPSMPGVAPPDLRPDAPPAMFAFLSVGAFEIAAPLPSEPSAPEPRPHPFWIRTYAEVPEDPWSWGAVHAYWSDLGLNGDARRVHHRIAGPLWSVSATHAVWLHRRTPPHEWHLFDVAVQSLHGNLGYVQASLFHGSGALSASAGQTVFVRAPTDRP